MQLIDTIWWALIFLEEKTKQSETDKQNFQQLWDEKHHLVN